MSWFVNFWRAKLIYPLIILIIGLSCSDACKVDEKFKSLFYSQIEKAGAITVEYESGAVEGSLEAVSWLEKTTGIAGSLELQHIVTYEPKQFQTDRKAWIGWYEQNKCDTAKTKSNWGDNDNTAVEQAYQVVEDLMNSNAINRQTDLWNPISYDPNSILLITAHFSECGEWGGHYEKLTIVINDSLEPYLNYERYKVACDSVNPLNGSPYQIPDYTKHLKLNAKNTQSIENYITRLSKSKLGERFPGHAGNEFLVVNHDSTLLLSVYDNKQTDVESYYKLLNELKLNER